MDRPRSSLGPLPLRETRNASRHGGAKPNSPTRKPERGRHHRVLRHPPNALKTLDHMTRHAQGQTPHANRQTCSSRPDESRGTGPPTPDANAMARTSTATGPKSKPSSNKPIHNDKQRTKDKQRKGRAELFALIKKPGSVGPPSQQPRPLAFARNAQCLKTRRRQTKFPNEKTGTG